MIGDQKISRFRENGGNLCVFTAFWSNLYFCFSAGPLGPRGPRGPPGWRTLSSSASQSQSAFSVRLGEYNPSSKRTIHFRQIIYNKQNHYSAKTGLFTCVIPGVYQFSFLCTSFISAGSVDLWRNNKVVLRGFKVFQGGQYLSSGDTVLQLEKGDKVWLDASEGTTGLSTKSFFSGHLLFAVWHKHLSGPSALDSVFVTQPLCTELHFPLIWS